LAEAAASGASYLAWPTWPEKERPRMISLIRPQADLLRRNEKLLNDARPRRDVALFLPFRKWLETDRCQTSRLAAELTRANVQYGVICEDDLLPLPSPRGEGLPKSWRATKVLLADSRSDFLASELPILENFSRAGGTLVTAEKTDWLKEIQHAVGTPSIHLHGPPTVRAIVRDQPRRTIIHLLNLNIQRISSFEDKVTPASDLQLTVRVPFARVRAVRALTADAGGTSGPLPFSAQSEDKRSVVELKVPRVEIAALLVIE